MQGQGQSASLGNFPQQQQMPDSQTPRCLALQLRRVIAFASRIRTAPLFLRLAGSSTLRDPTSSAATAPCSLPARSHSGRIKLSNIYIPAS